MGGKKDKKKGKKKDSKDKKKQKLSCPQCGEKIPAKSKFCPLCGYDMQAAREEDRLIAELDSLDAVQPAPISSESARAAQLLATLSPQVTPAEGQAQTVAQNVPDAGVQGVPGTVAQSVPEAGVQVQPQVPGAPAEGQEAGQQASAAQMGLTPEQLELLAQAGIPLSRIQGATQTAAPAQTATPQAQQVAAQQGQPTAAPQAQPVQQAAAQQVPQQGVTPQPQPAAVPQAQQVAAQQIAQPATAQQTSAQQAPAQAVSPEGAAQRPVFIEDNAAGGKKAKASVKNTALVTTRVVLGIMAIALAGVVTAEVAALGLASILLQYRDLTAMMGLAVVAGLFLGGLFAILMRKRKVGTIVSGLLMLLGGGAGMGYVTASNGLMLWIMISFVFGAVLVVTGFLQKGRKLRT